MKEQPYLSMANLVKISKEIPEILPIEGLQNVHLGVKKNVPCTSKMGLPPGRKTAIFCKKLVGLTSNPEILEIVSGLKIPFMGEPKQIRPPHQAKMNREQSAIVNQEIQAMLRKGAAHEVNRQKGQFLSNQFLVKKERWGEQTSDKFEATECVHSLPTFQNGGSASVQNLLKEMMQEKDYMCKTDLKDA